MTAPVDIPPIELIYFAGCPYVDQARAALRAALRASGFPDEWREWDQARPDTPARVLAYGSPTILVDGRDITGMNPANAGRACRADGTPSAAGIQAALAAWRQA